MSNDRANLLKGVYRWVLVFTFFWLFSGIFYDIKKHSDVFFGGLLMAVFVMAANLVWMLARIAILRIRELKRKSND